MDSLKFKKGRGLKVYEPEKRFEAHKGAVSFFAYISVYLQGISSFLAIGYYSLLMFVAGIFKAKHRFDNLSIRREKVLDLRKARRNFIH